MGGSVTLCNSDWDLQMSATEVCSLYLQKKNADILRVSTRGGNICVIYNQSLIFLRISETGVCIFTILYQPVLKS